MAAFWWRRLATDLVSSQSRHVLGPAMWARLCGTFLTMAPTLARRGLQPLDHRMGRSASSFRYRGRRIRFDCEYADRTIADGTYAFGAVREILIRDCYLKHLPPDTLERIRTAVDLGANRGLFSMLAAAWARRVLSVDADPVFAEVRAHNAWANGFDHVVIETAMVGRGGKMGGPNGRDITDLLDAHGLTTVDLLKIDIEGSEFALFEQTAWLSRVDRLCMEVHPAYGSPETITAALESAGFTVVRADSAGRVGPGHAFDHVYAWRAG
jgi:hypothetical protein